MRGAVVLQRLLWSSHALLPSGWHEPACFPKGFWAQGSCPLLRVWSPSPAHTYTHTYAQIQTGGGPNHTRLSLHC